MAGIYIHIPFCRKACYFCNFHFSTSFKQKERMLNAILKEIELRKDELASNPIQSIYLGGGTPSVLNEKDLDSLFSALGRHFTWPDDAEITLEANPDDLNDEFLHTLKKSPVNRLSIGLQSLEQEQLEWMNRSHTAEQTHQVVGKVKKLGFDNITVDWLYGYPGLTDDQLLHQLNWMKSFSIPHFSAYALTIEPNTVLAYRIQNGMEPEWDDELSALHFDLIMDWAAENDYEHYEISNFARPGFRAIHNSSYWTNKAYLGIGPSAHSYIERKRQWNIANNAKYMKAIEKGQLEYEREILTPKDEYNEWIMTHLRLKEGLDLTELEDRFNDFQSHFQKMISRPEIAAYISYNNEHIKLNRKGKHFADRIASSLFIA